MNYADRIRPYLDLPGGYKCVLDKSGNVLIHNSKLGFCITDTYCRGRTIEQVKAHARQVFLQLQKLTKSLPADALWFDETQVRQSVKTEFDPVVT